MATQNYGDSAGLGDHELRVAPKFQVIAHVNPPDGRTELTARLSWSDEGSARLFVTALLRNLCHGNFGQEGYRCWCEVWVPDETGEFVDSACPGQQIGRVEWDSEIIDAVAPA
jgi:hypothetical protein